MNEQEAHGPSHYTVLYQITCTGCGHRFKSTDPEAGCPACKPADRRTPRCKR